MTFELVLSGCAPTPLAHYLKALGILRLVAEQVDEAATGCWKGESFVLRSVLNREQLIHFFLHDYRPAPIIAPWNGGSGFFPKDNREAMDALVKSRATRFKAMREAIAFGKDVVKRARLTASPKNETKANFLSVVRANAPEALLAWLDAAILLTTDEPRYPPLLGTGGNDGRLDFTNNFMQRLVDLFEVNADTPTDTGKTSLPSALFGEAVPGLISAAIGQFNPGGAGGPNAGTGFDAESLINPWDFVFMLEGALVFATAATRRLESAEMGALSYPFTVRTVGSGSGGTVVKDEGQARAEIWLPLWNRFATMQEIKVLFAEGRATVGRRPARDGLDFARAVAALGINRGIVAFQRYGFLMRSGKAYLATPLNRFFVRRNPDADLISDLDQTRFLDRLRRFARDPNAPGRIKSLTRRLEDELFNLAQQSSRSTLQAILVLLGRLDGVLSESRKAREAGVPPVPSLSAQWVNKANDESVEFRIALGLAGIDFAGVPMRIFISPVQSGKNGWEWDENSRRAVWGRGSLVANLGDLLQRQILESKDGEASENGYRYSAAASGSDVAAFLAREIDDTRIAQLLCGLVLTRVPENISAPTDHENTLPGVFAVLKPFFTPNWLLRRLGLLPRDPTARLTLPNEIPRLLKAGRVDKAVEVAWRRLKIAGVSLAEFPVAPPFCDESLDGQRLLAALTIPQDREALRRVFHRLPRPISKKFSIPGGL